MKQAIQVLYKCTCCNERTITVPVRGSAEDIKSWMDKLTAALSQDHLTRSPFCRSTTMTYVKVPIENDESAMIGGPVRSQKREGGVQ